MKVKEKEEAQEFVKQQENIVKAKHRDISIDLVRVVACLMVIATHVCLQVLNPCFNRIDWSRLL